jgi:hypothetical protein
MKQHRMTHSGEKNETDGLSKQELSSDSSVDSSDEVSELEMISSDSET